MIKTADHVRTHPDWAAPSSISPAESASFSAWPGICIGCADWSLLPQPAGLDQWENASQPADFINSHGWPGSPLRKKSTGQNVDFWAETVNIHVSVTHLRLCQDLQLHVGGLSVKCGAILVRITGPFGLCVGGEAAKRQRQQHHLETALPGYYAERGSEANFECLFLPSFGKKSILE